MWEFLPMIMEMIGGSGGGGGMNLGMGGGQGMGQVSGMMSEQQNPPGLMTEPMSAGTNPPPSAEGTTGPSPMPVLDRLNSLPQSSGGTPAQEYKDMSEYNGTTGLFGMMNQIKKAQRDKTPRGRMDNINNNYLQGLMGG